MMVAMVGGGGGRVFISYAHDNPAHKAAVRALWELLGSLGFAARLDVQFADGVMAWAEWMEAEVEGADFVLVVASPKYRERAARKGPVNAGRGVWYEARLLRNMIYRDKGVGSLQRILPVVLPGGSVDDLPGFFAPYAETYFPINAVTETDLGALLLVLRGQVGMADLLAGGVAGARALRRRVRVDVTVADGRVRSRVTVGAAEAGEREAAVPFGIERAFSSLDRPAAQAAQELAVAGRRLAGLLFDEPALARLTAVVDGLSLGESVEVTVCTDGAGLLLPFELVRLADDRVLATVAGVRMVRRIRGVDGADAGSLPGPLKILAAVAAPEHTTSAPLDVEAEMQAIVDVVADLGAAEVTILEVASLGEIAAALHRDQFHVLHLSAHGSATRIELEDEDGNAVLAGADELVQALQHGGRAVPLIVLSSCAGAAGGDTGLAATLVRRGADRVLAMQAPVSDTYATALLAATYRELATTNASVAAALAHARTNSYHPSDTTVRPEYAVATLLAAAGDPPLCDPDADPVHLSRPVDPPIGGRVRELKLGELIGRRPQLRQALAALRGGTRFVDEQGASCGVVFTGLGGIGKTALAGRVIGRLREDTTRPWTVAVHEGLCTAQSLLDTVTGAAPQLAQVDDAHQLDAVYQLVERNKLLLVFDDFETNLTAGGASFNDPDLAGLFGRLCSAAGAGAGRLLVTCRYPIPGAADLHRIEVPPLTPAELRRLLLRLPTLRDLGPDDRVLLAATIGGHPRLVEFTDALMRGQGGRARLTAVAERLRHLAAAEGISIATTRRRAPQLGAATRQALTLGSRDILLDQLLTLLTASQSETLLQAAVSTVAMSVADLGHARHGDREPDHHAAVDDDVVRLVDLTLMSTAAEHDVVVHTWVGEAMAAYQGPSLVDRHNRAYAMRLHRINTGRGTFDDLAEAIRHLAAANRPDELARFSLHAADLVSGQVGKTSLLAQARSLLAPTHPDYPGVLDAEHLARLNSGDPTGATARAQELLAVLQARAEHDPGNVGFQRDLSVSYERLGDLAVAGGDVAAARELFTQGLTIAQRLAQADPGNVGFQRDLSVSYNKLGELAVAGGDVAAARELFTQGLTIRQRLAQADPGNVGFQRDLSISYERLGDLAIADEQLDAARQYFGDTLALWEHVLELMPTDVYAHHARCVSYDRLARTALASDNLAEARRLWSQAAAIAQHSVNIDAANTRYQQDLTFYQARVAELDAAATAPTPAQPPDTEPASVPGRQEPAPVPRQRHGWLNRLRRR